MLVCLKHQRGMGVWWLHLSWSGSHGKLLRLRVLVRRPGDVGFRLVNVAVGGSNLLQHSWLLTIGIFVQIFNLNLSQNWFLHVTFLLSKPVFPLLLPFELLLFKFYLFPVDKILFNHLLIPIRLLLLLYLLLIQVLDLLQISLQLGLESVFLLSLDPLAL